MKSNKYILFILLGILSYSCSSVPEESDSMRRLLKAEFSRMNYIDTNDIEDKVRSLVIKGSEYQQQWEYAEAAIEFQEALRYDSSATIHYALARCYKELEKYHLAVEQINFALEREPEFVPALELLAEIYISTSELNNAIAVYKRLSEVSNNTEFLKTLARLYEFDDRDKAIEIYEQLLEKGEYPNILNRLSGLYRQAGKYNEYLEVNNKLFDYNPNARSAVNIVDGYVNEKDYEMAINFLEKVDNSLPSTELPVIYSAIANALYSDNNVDTNLIKSFLSKLDNRFYFEWRIMIMGGFLCHKIDEDDKRDEYFDRAISVSDSVSDIPFQIGLFYFQNKEYLPSLEIFQTNEKNFSDDIRYPLLQGIVLSQMGKNERAIVPLTRALVKEPENVEILSQIGIIYDQLKNFDSSRVYYQKALIEAPGDPLINNNLAYNMAVAGENLEKALRMSKLAITSEPENSAYMDTFGWINYKMGKYHIALEYVLKAVNSGDAGAEVYEHLIEIYIKLDRKEDALKTIEKAARIFPDNNIFKKEKFLIK